MRYAIYTSMIFCLAVSGCCSTPFATSVNSINFKGEQQAAVIQLSDPQVYARETLINDRRDEVDYLRKLLDESETIQFRPQLKRDLQTLTGFVAQLQATVDVGAGRAFRRDDELQDLEFQRRRIEAEEALVRARASLQQARNDLNAAQSSSVSSGGQSGDIEGLGIEAGSNENAEGGTEGENQQGNSEQGAGTESSTNVEDIKLGEVNAILNRLDKFKNLMDSLANAVPVREADIQQTPQEIFRDRQAYRAELRAALADVNLDDVHDIEGNALYRFQFRATVLPGKHKDKVAVTRLTLKPPVLSQGEVASLYGAWIMYINGVLNAREKKGLADDFVLIGDLTGLYELIKLPTSNGLLSVAAFPGTGEALKAFWGYQGKGGSAQRSTQDMGVKKAYKDALNVIKSVKRSKERCPSESFIKSLNDALDSIYYSIRRQKQVVGVLLSVSRARSDNENGYGKRVREALLKAKEENQRESEELLKKIKGALKYFWDCSDKEREELEENIEMLSRDLKALSESGSFYVSHFSQADPKNFTHATRNAISRFGYLIRNAGAALPAILDRSSLWTSESIQDPYRIPLEVRGTMNAFFAKPVEFSQRVSTVQSAASAVELALALRGALQPKGLSGMAGAGYVRQAVGRIEALERAPMVVGFSDRVVGECEIPEPPKAEKPVEPDEAAMEGLSNEEIDKKWEDYDNRLSEYRYYEHAYKEWKNVCAQSAFKPVSPQVGWVFGPRLVPGKDGKTLELRQSIVNHAVSADISVPGWWPRINIEIEKAWIGNWYGDKEGQIFSPDSTEIAKNTMSVALPRNQADLQSITSLVLRGLGHAIIQPEIWEIVPKEITVCEKSKFLEIQVKGRNLWQGAEAYLNGRPQNKILLLPDMGGLNLTFELKDLPQVRLEEKTNHNAELVIWTRDGYAKRTFRIDRAEPGSQFCAGPASSAPVVELPSLLVKKPWFKTGDKVKLQFADAKPLRAYHSLEVFVQPFSYDTGASLGSPVKYLTNPPVNRETGIIKVDMKDKNTHKLTVNGSAVQFSVELKEAPTTKPLRKNATTRPVFYTESGDAFGIVTSGEITVPSESATFDVTVSGPPWPHIRYPDIPALPGSPSGHIMKMEAEFASPTQAATKLEGGNSWTVLKASDDTTRYTTKFWLVPPSGDSRTKFVEALKKGLDIRLRLTTPNDPRNLNPKEIIGSIKVKLHSG